MVKAPSMDLVTIMYDFKKDKNNPDNYSSSIEMLRDMTNYGLIKYFKDKSCSGPVRKLIYLSTQKTGIYLIDLIALNVSIFVKTL